MQKPSGDHREVGERPSRHRHLKPIRNQIRQRILLVALLGVLFYCARMLLALISPALRTLVILLVTVIALYVIVVLLGFVRPHVPVRGFR